MTGPDGYAEELALERAAVTELHEQAGLYWQAGLYGCAREATEAAREAAERVLELERRRLTEAEGCEDRGDRATGPR